MAECETCRRRGSTFELREPHINSPDFANFDSSGGLERRGDDIYECAVCGCRYARRVEEASMFHDYDEYYFTRVD